MKIAIVTASDRASRGDYEDLSGPAIADWLASAVTSPYEILRRIVPDGIESVRDTLIDLCDREGAALVFTTGGTGPSPRDLTPEAMAAVIEKELPGFGELLRLTGLQQTPTAILSRQTAGIRGRSLIVNLPGQPASITLSLQAIFAAIPKCLDLIGAGRMTVSDRWGAARQAAPQLPDYLRQPD
ncbi:molybdopterin adenylyltransferase [Cereibacter sphaeroides]|uniref:molybdopterin adenylyltransferase n=1 Tax=Rhodobacterales TaxID=204455 RepID=UPI000BBE0EDD|nr:MULTISPECIES: molybdopterin adenylyltransferase [Paracoccaceae]MCE6951851.1 molybdopterin adenylyltransferase [Cereibacter sphaeroides]MCE6961163.1 molybdopterin adenylyltransferase [Cereibacter sphaeroides]MCE6970149.1 molybdopterin adenylyltransferase [Cereibacter sphaeroides]MCE6974112.1 molybdopterin adenylyltransferase [Cereibacter sphaeroides]